MARSDWRRVSRRRPCPVCGKPDWCLYAGDESAPSAAICCRVESDKRAGEGGWLHVLRSDGPSWTTWRRTIHVAESTLQPSATIAEIRAEWIAASRATTAAKVSDLAAGLGVSATSLFRLHTAWMPKRKAWGFAMLDAQGRLVGVRLRTVGGKKFAIKGSREGLFYSQDLHAGSRLLVCEGPTDTAALLDLGFDAVGRPSCTGGTKHIVALVKRLQPEEVVIVADSDTPGQRGADRLASALLPYVPAVKVIAPPEGVKDARCWKQAGATAADVNTGIEGTKPRTLKIACRAVGIKHQGKRLRERTLPKA